MPPPPSPICFSLVLKNREAPGVRVKYGTQNQTIQLWLFENRKHYDTLVKPSLLEERAAQHDEDRV